MITILLSRNKLMGLSLIALAALSACADEIEKGRNDRFVSFSVNTQENNGWIDGKDSRVAHGQAEPHFFEPIEMEGQNGKPLYLIGEVTQSSVADVQYISRGTQIEPSLDGMQPFGVTAFLEGGKYMDNVEVTREKSGSTVTWKPASNYLWPAGKVLDFYARHPLVLDGLTMNSDLTGADYTVNADNGKQADLMFAVAKGETEPAGGGSTSLAFNHALTAVKFVCGANMEAGTLKSISLENVCSQGTYAVEGMTWSDVKTPATFSLSVDKSTAGSKEDDALTDNTQTFFMIPQTLGTDAKVKVEFEDATGTKTLTAKIGGQKWERGTTVTYRVSTTSIIYVPEFEVIWPSNGFTYKGGYLVFAVKSFRTSSKGDKQVVPWKAEFSTDGGASWQHAAPTWLQGFTSSGAGSLDYVSGQGGTVNEQVGVDISTHTPTLRVTPSKGSKAEPYNLSNSHGTKDVVENTANCYVLNAPGWYSFPLVYGNAIKNGATNASAYTSTAPDEKYVLNPFINHTGNGITDPYISKNADCTPAKAELVWQDSENLVTDIQYNPGTNGGNISFQVKQESIHQGNAVIAIKDVADNVLWSWHIWVTDEDINKTITITNFDNENFDVMSVNLGYCNGPLIDYAERSCLVKFTAGTEVRGPFEIKQDKGQEQKLGNNTYYQWGRKDPILPLIETVKEYSEDFEDYVEVGFVTKKWYDKNGASSTSEPVNMDLGAEDDFIKSAILNPNARHVSSGSGGDGRYKNLWSADCNVFREGGSANMDVVKTIYDPSPIGFKLPAGNTFTGVTITGKTESNESKISGKWDEKLMEWSFYTDNSKLKTIIFPSTGQRRHFNDEYYWNEYGISSLCWLAPAVNTSNAYNFQASPIGYTFFDGVYPHVEESKAAAMSIRCVRE